MNEETNKLPAAGRGLNSFIRLFVAGPGPDRRCCHWQAASTQIVLQSWELGNSEEKTWEKGWSRQGGQQLALAFY
jgi:hypothetical protein